MHKRDLQILNQSIQWIWLCIRYRINYKKVVLVLTNENERLDYYAVTYLKYFVKRKYAESAIILFHDKKSKKIIEKFHFPFEVKPVFYPLWKMEKLYDYYSFEKFFDNIVFTYTTLPKCNLLGRVLEETSVDERAAVCLALYHLRKVLEVDKENMEKHYAC